MTTSGKQLAPGIYIQIYRGAMNAQQQAGLGQELDKYKQLGITGIAWHGFSSEMTSDKVVALSKLCSDRGLISLAAFGMGHEDFLGMGQRIGVVAKLSVIQGVILDAEGAWELKDPNQANQDAIAMGNEIRAAAPSCLLLSQPWPVPTVHMSWPFDGFASFIDVQAPQWYCNDFTSTFGIHRYAKCNAWFSSSWATLDKELAPKGLVRPEIHTIQGYSWDDITADLVNCLTSNPVLIVWCEPFLSPGFIKGLEIKNKLASLNFTGPEAVLNFQKSTNGKLTADNVCGPLTQKELGF